MPPSIALLEGRQRPMFSSLLRDIFKFALFAILLGGDAHAVNEAPAPNKTDLGTLLKRVQERHGLRIQWPESLSHDVIAIPASQTQDPDLARLLKGYNWIGVRDVTGAWSSVSITGRNGDGHAGAPSASSEVPFKYRAPPKRIPKKYRGLPKGSVYPVDISVAMLRKMSLGQRLVLNLPSGDHALLHDRAWDHANGDRTWVGKEITDQGLYRTLITLGDHDQIDGQIVTPEGTYQLESDQNGQWLIDLKASGLQPGSFDQGGIPPVIPAVVTSTMASAGSSTAPSSPSPGFTGGSSGQRGAQIDLLLLYTEDLSNSDPLTRLNSLIAFANQAMIDSKVSIQFNLLDAKEVAYSHEATNLVALNQLTSSQDAFKSVNQQREKLGADLVLLIRPFHPTTADNSCGDAWINGGSGSGLSPDLAFGVVNDGRAGGLYCSNYTLAHELGHLLGAAHDRSHASSPGHFSYSYGYGKQGIFGDIMSYFSPEVGIYANPDLTDCLGERCGIEMGKTNEADVAATLKETGPVVAQFATISAH